MRRFLILFYLPFFLAPAIWAHRELTGATPSLSSCGSTPTIVGNDNVGIITVGSGVITACTLTFAQAWTNTPICTITSDSTSINLGVTSVSTTAITFGFSLSLGGGKVYYQCYGRQ